MWINELAVLVVLVIVDAGIGYASYRWRAWRGSRIAKSRAVEG